MLKDGSFIFLFNSTLTGCFSWLKYLTKHSDIKNLILTSVTFTYQWLMGMDYSIEKCQQRMLFHNNWIDFA